MFRTRVISLFIALSLVAASGVAMAQGGGHRGGDRALFLLAKAAGLTGSQIRTAFKSDANLGTDRANVKSTHQALVACLVTGAACGSQATAYLGAKQALEQETLSVWQGLFLGNPNPSNAATVLSQLQALQAQRKQIFQQAFTGGGGE